MTNATKVFAAAALFVASTALVAEAQMRPAAGYQSQWYTTPDGCSYSRTHAPRIWGVLGADPKSTSHQ